MDAEATLRVMQSTLTDILDSIEDAPAMWGALDAVELQFLLALQLQQKLRHPEGTRKDKTNPRWILERYSKAKAKLLGTNPTSTLGLPHYSVAEEHVLGLHQLLRTFRREVEENP